MRLIVPPAGAVGSRRADPKLATLINKAQDWFGRFASGRAFGAKETAQQDRGSPSYVTRVVYIAFSAPDLVKKIAGPQELTADQLARLGPPPNDWDEQRRLLGFAG